MSIDPEVFNIAGTSVAFNYNIGNVLRKPFSYAGIVRSKYTRCRRSNGTNKYNPDYTIDSLDLLPH